MKKFTFTLLVLSTMIFVLSSCSSGAKKISSSPSKSTTVSSLPELVSEQDLSKLPLGDGLYSSSAKAGYIYSCQKSFDSDAPGAENIGPWINGTNKTWDATQKLTVDGDVKWEGKVTIEISGNLRIITSNALPGDHGTGEFPISSSDDAYAYDRNPNKIAAQSISYSLPVAPTKATSPECVGGEVGIAINGIPIFSGFDAGGRDAVAHEVQDECDGHPQVASEYHYHNLSSCIDAEQDAAGHPKLIGYALDGYGIFGPNENGKVLTNEDLDSCHGKTSEIIWDGKAVSMYHYVATAEFPYTVGCFTAKAVQADSKGGGENTGPPSK